MAKRDWQIDYAEFEYDEQGRQAVAAELAALENIGHRIGGAFIVTPIRVKDRAENGDVIYDVVGWHFEHVNAPAVSRRQLPEAEVEPEPVADVEPDVEPVAAEG